MLDHDLPHHTARETRTARAKAVVGIFVSVPWKPFLERAYGVKNHAWNVEAGEGDEWDFRVVFAGFLPPGADATRNRRGKQPKGSLLGQKIEAEGRHEFHVIAHDDDVVWGAGFDRKIDATGIAEIALV